MGSSYNLGGSVNMQTTGNTTGFSSSSTSWVDVTGLTLTTSKACDIVAIFSGVVRNSNTNSKTHLRILEGSNVVAESSGDTRGETYATILSGLVGAKASIASGTVVKVQMKVSAGTGDIAQETDDSKHLTLIEI